MEEETPLVVAQARFVRCSKCSRTVELPRIRFNGEWRYDLAQLKRYDLAQLKGWVGVPWICPDCIRGEEVAKALMEEENE